ncbi:hypothetical protein [Paenibacillus sp. MMO-58]|uniref:hypothetical protein n=1 Tax=Paenibacillus sp. MMO-58 TaxID=3081290 RepID=UPI00301948AF
MKEDPKFPYKDELLRLKAGEQLVLHLDDKTFIVQVATDQDLDISHCGYFAMLQ